MENWLINLILFSIFFILFTGKQEKEEEKTQKKENIYK